MEWIKVENSHELPRNGDIFLAIWKGRISMCQFDQEEGRFYIMFEPADYSQSWCIDQSRENKFTHWMSLPEKPKE
jgi:hypothetical protein